MIVELSVLGIFVGMLSGFFGIGGGTLSIPILLYLGFGIKEAIAISVMQMMAGSLMAAWIHAQKQTYEIKEIKYFGFGGLVGAVIGGAFVKFLEAPYLEGAFLAIIAFTLVRMAFSSPVPTRSEIVNRPLYGVIGTFVGIFSGMLGIGGSILMTPILVSFMGFELKKASAIGLFFVLFTSFSSCVTLGVLGMLKIQAGLIVAVASLLGIHAGIWLTGRVHIKQYKYILIVFYTIIFALSAYKLIVE